MPGLNKKGPQNKGPMTGGKSGLCVSDGYETQGLNTKNEEMPGRGKGLRRGQGNRVGRCCERGAGKRTFGKRAGRGGGR